MTESNKDVDKKLKTSAKPGGSPPAKGDKTDTDTAKTKGLLDELDSKLDDLFGFDEKEAEEAEDHQIIKSPFDDIKETSTVPKTADPVKDKAEEVKTVAPSPPAAPPKKEADASAPGKIAPAATDSIKTTVQKQKEPLPSIKKAQSAPIAKAPTVGKKPQPSPVEKSKPAPIAVPDSKAPKTPTVKPAAPAPQKPEIKPVGKSVSGQIKQKPLELGSFQPIHPNEIEESRKKTDSSKPTKAETADKLKTKSDLPGKLQIKEQRPANAAAVKKPADKIPAGKDPKEKPIISKTKSGPRPEKISPIKDIKTPVPAKPVESKKESKKSDPKQGKKKSIVLKLAIGGIILVGGMIALLTFFQTQDPSRQSQPVAAPTVNKIIKPPAKAPETKPTPPTAQTIPKRPEPAVSQPDVPPTATPAHEKKSAPPTTPAKNAADEIKDFLQEWKTAWEKSAGEKGDTDAFMSFYAEGFTSNGLDKNKWRRNKAEKNRRKAWIRITLDKINIIGPLGNGRYEARFTQAYQSSNYADTSNQVLVLQKEASDWKIIGTNPQTSTSSYPYSLHDGSYRTLTATREAIEAYRKMGLEAYWTSVDLGEKGTWYRVFIGYYNNLASARRIIEVKSLTDVRPEETRYANLIGTYASEDDLQPKRRLIAESGYSPYVIMDDNGKLSLYVGAHVSLKNAEKLSDELSARGISSRVVER
ncbi:MAG: SPOR domain-containing protein [Desulfobacterales bacterium]|nr:SPOR domain-containing protein [Desulfobacterales bacterium]